MISKISTLSLLASLLFAIALPAAEVRGIIVKADPDRKEFSIEARGRGVRGMVLTFQVDRDTQIRKGQEARALADLAAGDRVRVVYEADQGRRTALVVTVQPPLLSGLSSLLGSGPEPAPVPAPAPRASGGLTGVLRRVALTDREIVLITPEPQGGAETETTLLVSQDAKITRDQKPIRLEDLKEGETAVVVPEKKEGKLWAQTIQIGAVAALPAAPPPDNRIAKIRQILKMVDLFLQSQENR